MAAREPWSRLGSVDPSPDRIPRRTWSGAQSTRRKGGPPVFNEHISGGEERRVAAALVLCQGSMAPPVTHRIHTLTVPCAAPPHDRARAPRRSDVGVRRIRRL